MNHKLRDELTGVYGWAERLVLRKSGGPVDPAAREVYEAADHTIILLNNFLDLMRLASREGRPGGARGAAGAPRRRRGACGSARGRGPPRRCVPTRSVSIKSSSTSCRTRSVTVPRGRASISPPTSATATSASP